MVEKYVCLANHCDFCTDIEDEAYDHSQLGKDHLVVGVIKEDDKIQCHQLGEELRKTHEEHEKEYLENLDEEEI